MLLLEPSLRYALGGNFPSAGQSEGAAATELFHVGAACALLKTKSGSLSRGHSACWPLGVYIWMTIWLLWNVELTPRGLLSAWGKIYSWWLTHLNHGAPSGVTASSWHSSLVSLAPHRTCWPSANLNHSVSWLNVLHQQQYSIFDYIEIII